ncbi:MAG: hypothetical protein HZB99_01995 [Candidatus Harrisonbacteria bacterium]|nr:hypothetical protein [Candidatus Harrisonbacteria bacterium]
MKIRQFLAAIMLMLLALILLVPLYELHSRLVDVLAQLSAKSAIAIFDVLGLKK